MNAEDGTAGAATPADVPTTEFSQRHDNTAPIIPIASYRRRGSTSVAGDIVHHDDVARLLIEAEALLERADELGDLGLACALAGIGAAAERLSLSGVLA